MNRQICLLKKDVGQMQNVGPHEESYVGPSNLPSVTLPLVWTQKNNSFFFLKRAQNVTAFVILFISWRVAIEKHYPKLEQL